MDHDSIPRAERTGPPTRGSLSYKFQRLRERIREAIVNGEFTGQLPGERALGRRFGANAKTINKALGDLSGEGLVVRIIGRGTFVADSAGRVPIAEARREFQILAKRTGDAAPYQARLLASVGDALAGMGHRFTVIHGDDGASGQPFTLDAWPAPCRSAANGLIVLPFEPLSKGGGFVDEGMISEAWRRHVPVVVAGACATEAKVHAVVPDYVSAGFGLAEHLIMLGCKRLTLLSTCADGRELRMVHSGCRTAAQRHQREVTHCMIGDGDWAASVSAHAGSFHQHVTGMDAVAHPAVGLICVGNRSLVIAHADPTVARLVGCGELAITCVTEPGDRQPEAAQLTSFEFDPSRIASWAAKLVAEWKPGQRPMEVIVPGVLCVRDTIRANPGQNGRRIHKLECATQTRAGLAEAMI